MKAAILASGQLGLNCLKGLPVYVEVICVLADSKSTGIIEWCENKQVPLFKGNPRTGKAGEFLKQYEIDILFSINYLFVIQKDILDCVKKYAFNIHGSLLPKYRGRTPHVWSIINNETKTGLTVHLIDEGCDSGDIIFQKELNIAKEMTGYDVLQQFEQLYPDAIQETLKRAAEGKIFPLKQDHTKATYFGKRTPDDGAINWEWQKERIYNWVRAQARPYPGAFTFYGNEKMNIHKIAMTEIGFHYEDPNGKILSIEEGKPVVKTSNGAITIMDYELNSTTELLKGEILHA